MTPMTPTTPLTPCPACGTPGEGAFCVSCGGARDARWCTACGGAIAAGGRFCSVCGTAVSAREAASAPVPRVVGGGAPDAAARPTWAYLVAGVAVVVVVLVMIWPRGPAPTPPPGAVAATGGGTGGAAAIDLSTMTPREQFDRLYDRVMRAAENGDEATVTQFSPMALQAYANLLPGDVDVDARYHAAMIRMHTSDLAGAAALADTIRAEVPSHLFSYVIHGTLARQRTDQAALRREQAAFLTHYDSEMASARPEYALHKFILDQFVSEARTAAGS